MFAGRYITVFTLDSEAGPLTVISGTSLFSFCTLSPLRRIHTDHSLHKRQNVQIDVTDASLTGAVEFQRHARESSARFSHVTPFVK